MALIILAEHIRRMALKREFYRMIYGSLAQRDEQGKFLQWL